MRIWIIDHYSVPTKYYPLARNTNFAKRLMKMGHDVTIFAASSVHNSDLNLIEDGKRFREIIDDGVKYVVVRCHQYSGNGVRRVLNMYEFAHNLEPVCDLFPRPDVILATSMTLQACKKGLQLGKKYGCKKVAQVTDLWPETLIAYGKASKYHPIVHFFRWIEKWIYINADKIIFSMEGAYDYIIEQGWSSIIPRSKVFYINNGVDLESFSYNRDHYVIDDEDLTNANIFKAIYTGSIRQINSVDMLVEAARMIRNPNIRILIWGDGDQRSHLEQVCKKENITNIKFKGSVEKKFIPYITSMAGVNLAHSRSSELFRFGMSLNKMFDYAAAEKPILIDFYGKYNPVIEMGAGLVTTQYTPEAIAHLIERFATMDVVEYKRFCDCAREMAKKYNTVVLTESLLDVIRS